MSLREVIGALLRQWGVLVIGVVLTALGGWLAIHPTPTYRALSVITLRAPRSENTPNQFSDGRPSIALTGAMISARMKSRSGEAQLRDDGVVGKYTIAPRNSGTTATPAYLIASVEITVVAHGEADSLRSLEAVISRFGRELDSMQADWKVPSVDRITVAVLAPPSVIALLVVKSRALLGVALLGGMGSVLVALWLDGYRTRRLAQR